MTEARFIVDSPATHISVELEGLTLAFHRPSGMTHILSAPVPEMLEALGEGPAGARVIVERLAARHQVDDRAEAEAVVSARLIELEAAGLVRRL